MHVIFYSRLSDNNTGKVNYGASTSATNAAPHIDDEDDHWTTNNIPEVDTPEED